MGRHGRKFKLNKEEIANKLLLLIVGLVFIYIGKQVMFFYQDFEYYSEEPLKQIGWVSLGFVIGVIYFIVIGRLLNNYFKFKIHKETLKESMVVVAVSLVVIIITNYFKLHIQGGFGTDFGASDSVNQELIVSTFKDNVQLSILSSCIFAPIIEELYFRKYFMQIVSIVMGKKELTIISAVLSGVFFGAGHWMLGSTILYAVVVTATGLLFALLYYYYGRIWLSMWIHILLNSSTTIVMMLIL